MFDIGFPELMLSALVGLLVIGPERLPEALRTLGLWLGRMRRSFQSVKAEIEKEIGMDEVRKQLHNEAVMEEMKRIEREVKATTNIAQDAARIDGHTPAQTASVSQTAAAAPTTEAASAGAQQGPPVAEPPRQAANPESN